MTAFCGGRWKRQKRHREPTHPPNIGMSKGHEATGSQAQEFIPLCSHPLCPSCLFCHRTLLLSPCHLAPFSPCAVHLEQDFEKQRQRPRYFRACLCLAFLSFPSIKGHEQLPHQCRGNSCVTLVTLNRAAPAFYLGIHYPTLFARRMNSRLKERKVRLRGLPKVATSQLFRDRRGHLSSFGSLRRQTSRFCSSGFNRRAKSVG